MTINIAYFGFGKSANRYHLPYVNIRKNFNVKTICSVEFKEELLKPYKDSKINFTKDQKVLLEDKDIQLVVICTHPNSHYELAKAALLSGKNVLVEKPFCPKYEEAIELLDLAKKNGLFCIPFQNRRFDGDFLTLKKVIESGKLGEVVEIESHFDYFRPDPTEHLGEYYDGAFYGLGVHTIDQLISIYGRPDAVYYDIRSLRNPKNPDDAFEVNLFYGTRKIIVKTSHLVKADFPRFIVYGKNGSFVKYQMDQQETCLKAGIMPQDKNFGIDPEKNYGTLDYVDASGKNIIEKVPTLLGDYGKVYDGIYEHLANGKELFISHDEVKTVMDILYKGFSAPAPHVVRFK